MRRAALLLALVLLSSCGSTMHTAAPDLILVGGKIFTSDDARPWAQAIAIRGDRIAAVGNSAEIRALAGKSTRVIDLAAEKEKGTLTPGKTLSRKRERALSAL
jgi:hypothetical protein